MITKRRARTKSKSRRSKPKVRFIDRPSISEIDAPNGFRAVSMSQAIMEYVKPLIDFVEKGIVKGPNDVLQLAMPLWNYKLSPEDRDLNKIKKDIIKLIGKTLKIDLQESTEFFDMMIQRKEHLFPTEVQPDSPMTMFIRQEEHYLIPEFNYHSLNISEEPYLPDDEDERFVQMIERMDRYIIDGVDYDEWEDHYFSI